MWDKETREYNAMCESVEQTLAETCEGGEEFAAHDFTARIATLPDGKFGLTFYAMALASGDWVQDEGDKAFWNELQPWADQSARDMMDHMIDEEHSGMAPNVSDNHPLYGQETAQFDSLDAMLVKLNEYRTEKRLPIVSLAPASDVSEAKMIELLNSVEIGGRC